MGSMLDAFFNPSILVRSWPLLLSGLLLTLVLIALVVPIGVLGGLLVALLNRRAGRILRAVLVFAIDVLRAIPPLVLLIFLFYGLPFLGVRLNELTAAVVALGLNGSSYFAEVFRAGLESVPRGQNESARSTGLSASQAMRYVVLPQAIRNVLPDLASNTLELSKQTAIASAVSLQELLRSAQIAQGLTFNPTPLIAAAAIYLVLLWPLVRVISRMQKQVRVIR